MRQLTAVMSPHPGILQYRQMLMPPQEGKAFQEFLQMLFEVFGIPGAVAFGCRMAEKNGSFAIGPRLEEENRGKEVGLP